MASFNSVTLVGNVVRDPEIKYLQDGTEICEVSIAVNEVWKDANGNKKEDVLYMDCSCWRKTAIVANEYLRKGSPVLFAGKLKMDRWEKDGVKHSKIRMTVERLVLLASKSSGERQEHAPPRSYDADVPTETAPQVAATSDAAGDLPF